MRNRTLSRRANDRWNKAHRSLQNYYVDKSKTKRFILKESSRKDLINIHKWISIRDKELKEY